MGLEPQKTPAPFYTKKQDSRLTVLFSVLALPIFPVRLQTSIFGASELNFRVRNGNGWTLTAINTNLLSCEQESKQRKLYAGSVSECSWVTIIHGLHCLASVSCSLLFASKYIKLSSFCQAKGGDPYGNRTHVCGVRGRRLNRLTNGPDIRQTIARRIGTPSGTRTLDTLIKSQVLYQLS